MSHYAKLVQPLRAYGRAQSAPVELPIGTEIKGVLSFDDGYTFAARIGKLWVMCQTAEDLPAFTDLGRAYREARAARVTLRKGRPTVSSKPATVRLVCKVTKEQATAVATIAKDGGFTVPRFLRHLLMKAGMPE